MDAKITGRIIYNKRKELGLTQKELADMIGVSNRAVSKWETGEGFPDIALLPDLSSALRISIDELLTGVKPDPIEIINEVTIEKNSSKNPRAKFLISEIIAFVLAFGADAIGCATEVRLFYTKPFYVFIEIYLLVLSVLLLVISTIIFFTAFVRYKYDSPTLSKKIIMESYIYTSLALIMPVFTVIRILRWYFPVLGLIFIIVFFIIFTAATALIFKRTKNETYNKNS